MKEEEGSDGDNMDEDKKINNKKTLWYFLFAWHCSESFLCILFLS